MYIYIIYFSDSAEPNYSPYPVGLFGLDVSICVNITRVRTEPLKCGFLSHSSLTGSYPANTKLCDVNHGKFRQ